VKFVIVFTKAIRIPVKNTPVETVYVYKAPRYNPYTHRRTARPRTRWFGARARRGTWTATHETYQADQFESVSAARRVVDTAAWCRLALANGWRASVRAVKSERHPGLFRHTIVTAEVWPNAQAIDALAAVLHEGERS